MKSIFILLFFILITYLTYKYYYNKYYTDNTIKNIKYILLPVSINDYFKSNNLENNYRYMFGGKVVDKEYSSENITKILEKTKIKNENNGKKDWSIQRYFTEF